MTKNDASARFLLSCVQIWGDSFLYVFTVLYERLQCQTKDDMRAFKVIVYESGFVSFKI